MRNLNHHHHHLITSLLLAMGLLTNLVYGEDCSSSGLDEAMETAIITAITTNTMKNIIIFACV